MPLHVVERALAGDFKRALTQYLALRVAAKALQLGLDLPLRGNMTSSVVQLACLQLPVALAGDLPLGVVQLLAGRDLAAAGAVLHDGAARVVQISGANAQGFVGRFSRALNYAALVVEALFGINAQLAVVACDQACLPLVLGIVQGLAA